MVQVYRAKNDGTVEKLNDHNYFTAQETTEKTIHQLDGDGDWHSLHGIKLLVDNKGTIIKGPDMFLGRRFSDIATLSYADVFTVMRDVERANSMTTKSLLLGVNQLTPKEKSDISNIKEKAAEFIEKKIAFYREIKESKKDPLYR